MDNKNVRLKISTSIENALSPLKYLLTNSSKMGVYVGLKNDNAIFLINWNEGTFS
jgi:hypothetical protein